MKKKKLLQYLILYLKTFEKLKNNCFISKEILFPIYDYFSNIYDIVNDTKEIIQNEITLKKFNKMLKLFEIFYETNIDKDKRNESSFCFIGGSIKIAFDQFIKVPNDNQIIIKLNILNNYCEYLKDNLFLIKVNDNEIKNKELKNIKSLNKLKNIKIIINEDKNKINYDYKEMNFTLFMKVNKEIKEIILFEEFYGQISSIDILIGNDKSNIEYQFLPLSIRNKNIIYYIKKKIFKNNKLIDIIPKLIIENKNLVNINYINYNDNIFDIIDYFGGIIQFLPFYRIFKNVFSLIRVNKENIINDKLNFNLSSNKYVIIYKDELNDFINYLIKIMIKKLFSL